MMFTALQWLRAQIFFNLGRVDKGIWRSRQGFLMYVTWPFLRLKTVINYSHKPDTDPKDKFEQWLCKVMRITYITYPTIGWEEAQDIARGLFENTYKRPVLQHCAGGKDRTGGVVGVYKWLAGFSLESIERDWKIYGRPYQRWIDHLYQFFDDNPRKGVRK